jgi:hypothetical protein
VLFGTKLDVDDVGNIGAEGTGTMKWDWEGNEVAPVWWTLDY